MTTGTSVLPSLVNHTSNKAPAPTPCLVMDVSMMPQYDSAKMTPNGQQDLTRHANVRAPLKAFIKKLEMH